MFGPNITTILTAANASDIAVASTGVVYTAYFRLIKSVYFGIGYRAVSASGTPSITIQLEQSWTLPVTEGSADTNYVIPVGISDIVTDLITETWNLKPLAPICMPYGRFKITGTGANPADTLVNIYLAEQEDWG